MEVHPRSASRLVPIHQSSSLCPLHLPLDVPHPHPFPIPGTILSGLERCSSTSMKVNPAGTTASTTFRPSRTTLEGERRAWTLGRLSLDLDVVPSDLDT